MPTYRCELCHKIFDHKGNYSKHIQRMTSCSSILIHLHETDTFSKEDCICSNCGKSFSNKNNKLKHEKNSKCNEWKIKIAELEEKIKIIETKCIGNSTINSNNHITINNFIMNPYKKEDISYLTNRQKIHIIQKYFKSVVALIELKHFNLKTPENCNIYSSNVKGDYSHYYNGITWVSTKNKELIQELYENNLNDVLEMYEELKEQLDDKTKHIFEKFIEETNTINNVKMNQYDIKMMLYNKREEIIKIKKMMLGSD